VQKISHARRFALSSPPSLATGSKKKKIFFVGAAAGLGGSRSVDETVANLRVRRRPTDRPKIQSHRTAAAAAAAADVEMTLFAAEK
jgi:hypothetical protein